MKKPQELQLSGKKETTLNLMMGLPNNAYPALSMNGYRISDSLAKRKLSAEILQILKIIAAR